MASVKGSLKAKEEKCLRKFGVMSSVAMCLWGCLFLGFNKQGYVYFFILAVFFISFGLFLPRILSPIHKLFSIFSICLGWVIKNIVLILLFFIILTPTAILAKVLGNKFMDLDFRDSRGSYWIPKIKRGFNRENYLKQY